MTEFFWVLGSGILMCVIALTGVLTLTLTEDTLQKILLPLVSLAAGTLLGSAFFHMLPEGLILYGNSDGFFIWVLAGFSVFFALEELLHSHNCRRTDLPCREPLGYLVLLGDGLHNLIGGLSIGALFIADIQLGIMAWLAAAAHELPQELGDFAVLIHSGWTKRKALLMNLASAMTFLLGGMIALAVSGTMDISFLVPFAAGNFIYIGASGLIPIVRKHENLSVNTVNFCLFITGITIMLLIRIIFT